jgi:hypothetical protein
MVTRILFLLMMLATPVVSQDQLDLDRLDQKLTKYFERVMPGWEHKRGEPIFKTANVLIQFWYSPNRAIKIAVSPRKSGEEARRGLQNFRKSERTEALSDVGDEAYAWGYGSANIAFRKGRYVFFVSTNAEVDADPGAHLLTQEQRFERERIEKRRLSLQFAKHASKALEDQ